MRWTITEAWEAATDVAALVYGVTVDGVRAPSRGRGPKPPLALRAPRKVAIWIAVQVADCDYAALGRTIGLHKDTISSHVTEVGLMDVVEELGLATNMLLEITRARLMLANTRNGNLTVPNRRGVVLGELIRLADALPDAVSDLSDGINAHSDAIRRGEKKGVAGCRTFSESAA